MQRNSSLCGVVLKGSCPSGCGDDTPTSQRTAAPAPDRSSPRGFATFNLWALPPLERQLLPPLPHRSDRGACTRSQSAAGFGSLGACHQVTSSAASVVKHHEVTADATVPTLPRSGGARQAAIAPTLLETRGSAQQSDELTGKPGMCKRSRARSISSLGSSPATATPLSAAPPRSEEDSTESGFMASPATTPSAGLKWRRGREIGSGSYGRVYTAMDMVTGQIFAAKQATFGDSPEDRKYVETLEKELAICKKLRHANIVSYLGHERTETGLYIYLEYMPGGSMATVLREFGALGLKQLKLAARDVLSGLAYLHKQRPPVVHRDVKAANLLVGLTFEVKLADFGLSKRDTDTKSLSVIGSVPWMAPEVIQQNEGHGRKADIWSFGCTMIEMATAETPWGKGCFNNIMFAIRHIGMSEATPPIPEHLPAPCRNLIALCLRRSPEERPSAKEALRDEFLRGATAQAV
jgi:hypothetical protein